MKILALDIETSPNIVYAWGLRKQDISPGQVIQETTVMCFAAMWIGPDKGTYPGGQRPKKDGTVFYGGLKHDREEMLHAAHDLLGQADAVVHYNGRSFDIPHLNREMLLIGLPPYPPVQEVDLLLAVRRRFRFVSSRLDHVSKAVGVGGKASHEGFNLWPRCMAGDELAWKSMERYNRQDVVITAGLYEEILPWLPSHPNVALHDQRPGACPRCGGTHLQRRGYARTKVSTFPQYQCQGCGGYFRGTKRVDSHGITEIAA